MPYTALGQVIWIHFKFNLCVVRGTGEGVITAVSFYRPQKKNIHMDTIVDGFGDMLSPQG
jgi:hypothetical protein